ncbi:LLM class flavin-dependent oxidoreductase [Micromonospora nigra]|uniref:LLM class flavin-dependent oxidoreductase n=1 Tax=Micromonospora nigra TaxID=145857 RepID=UPI000B88D620|nr:LLM class flavin-dependent oxidoreductase [Micromonospora nigra]
MEIGLISLADLTSDPRAGSVAPDEGIRRIVRLGQLAEQAGLDVFAVGEHHHPNYEVSSPAVVLAAVARATRRISLASATTLIGVLDPVRVYEGLPPSTRCPAAGPRSPSGAARSPNRSTCSDTT